MMPKTHWPISMVIQIQLEHGRPSQLPVCSYNFIFEVSRLTKYIWNVIDPWLIESYFLLLDNIICLFLYYLVIYFVNLFDC